MCVEFSYHSTSILAILDFQDSLDLSLDGDLLEVHIKFKLFSFLKHKYATQSAWMYFVYLFQASLSSSFEVFALSQLCGW